MATLGSRFRSAFNAFRSSENEVFIPPDLSWGATYSSRPDRPSFKCGIEQSIVNSVFTRIAIDVASADFHHCRLDQNGRFSEYIMDGLEECLTTEANIDQTGRMLIADIAASLCDEGVVAVVPVEASADPDDTESYDIRQLRTGRITQWAPRHVKVLLYDDRDGQKKEIWRPKVSTAIIENPLYSVMNEPNSTLRRLIHKLNILDAIDEQSGAGKLDLIIQLPYTIRSEQRRQQAESRRKDIEMQLAGSKYGIAYTDGTERITQLNRSVDNNLLNQITYLTTTLYNQLGLAQSIFDGTADEQTLLNYDNRTVKPFLLAIAEEFRRKFLSKTARTQGQSIMFFNDPFRLVPVSNLAEIADKLTRNAILSSNEVRAILSYKPVDDPRANELSNKNLNQDSNSSAPIEVNEEEEETEEEY